MSIQGSHISPIHNNYNKAGHSPPNDKDLSCHSELDSPELEPPSVVGLELEPDDDDEPESLPDWETSDKLLDSASSSTDSGSEGTSASEPSVFHRLVPLSLHLPRLPAAWELKYTDNERWSMVV